MARTQLSFDQIEGNAVSVKDYGAVGDGVTDDTAAIQAAVDAALATQKSATVGSAVLLFPPGHEYNLKNIAVESESTPLTIIAYGCWINVIDSGSSGFILSNIRHLFLGGTFRSTETDTTAIEITQTASASQIPYTKIKDVNIVNMYKGITSVMDQATYPLDVCYRITIESCWIASTGTPAAGSRGVFLGGDTIGDSSGNDSKIVNTNVSGFEKCIYSNGVRTSINNCSIDGVIATTTGVELDGSNCTLIDNYFEYHDKGVIIGATADSTTLIGNNISAITTADIDDSGQWTQIINCEPGINKIQQSEITPTGSQTALTINNGTSSSVPIVEVIGTGEFEIADDGAIHATQGSTGTSYTSGVHEVLVSAAAESGTPIVYFGGSTGKVTQLRPVSGTNGSATAMALRIPADNNTSRSINAGGTVNASGADYAEYMTKVGDFEIAKGDICGINSDGLITNIYEDAIAFVVKSTNPSYVGGDTWSELAGQEPEKGATEEEKALYKEKLEQVRSRVDRIAFCGQVPVNVYNVNPGDYIIPIKDGESISGRGIKNPSFEEYLLCVGKVLLVEPDGRARVIVKIS